MLGVGSNLLLSVAAAVKKQDARRRSAIYRLACIDFLEHIVDKVKLILANQAELLSVLFGGAAVARKVEDQHRQIRAAMASNGGVHGGDMPGERVVGLA